MNITFGELLRRPNVAEHCSLASRHLGFMAYHGGELEKVTDVIAVEAASRSETSSYALVQTDYAEAVHLPSASVDPSRSKQMSRFLSHVDAVVTIHGFGRKRFWHSVLLGGRNRALARHVARHLRMHLPDYEIIDDVSLLPVDLAGMHQDNPVNLARKGGVQIELPPTLRWNRPGRHWSDMGPRGRAPQTEALIQALAQAASQWCPKA